MPPSPVEPALRIRSCAGGPGSGVSPVALALPQRVQFQPPKEHLRPLALEQDLPGGGEDVAVLIHDDAVDDDRDPVVAADALDAGPLVRRALDVGGAAEAGGVFPGGVLAGPVDPPPPLQAERLAA